MIFRAPFPAMQTTTLLPNPSFSDSHSLAASFERMRTMNGTLYTYATSRKGRKVHRWDFLLSRHKALELKAFFDAYYGSKIQATDHNDQIIIGYFKNNPFEFSGAGAAGGWPGNEAMSISIEFEEAA